jgi:hypothetical protein
MKNGGDSEWVEQREEYSTTKFPDFPLFDVRQLLAW